MSNIGSYDERVKNFSWSIAEKELGYKPGDIINIGWYCTDRICQMGKADRVALYWEGFTGAEKTYTYNDIRLATNTIAGRADDSARWKAAGDQLRSAQAAWKRIGPVPDAASRALNARFQKAVARAAEKIEQRRRGMVAR